MTSTPANAALLQALCSRGLDLHRSGKLAEAAELYGQVLASDPRHFDALHFLGVLRIQTGQLEPAVELIDRAIRVRGDAAEAHGNLANALNGLGRWAEAAAAADRAIALAPGFAEAHGNRGQALQRLGRLDEAVASYGRAAALKPSAKAHFNHATVLRDLGRLSEALAAYDLALALAPNLAEALRGRAVVLQELGRLPEALQGFERALAVQPVFADAWLGHAATLRALKRPLEALASADQAVEQRPASAEAWCVRGNVLTDLRRHEDALAAYGRAAEVQPDYPEAHNNQAAALRALRRPTEALAAADRALALRPAYAEAEASRAGALYDLRRLDEALEACDRALALNPRISGIHDNRGVILFETRRFAQAMESFDHALALEPENAEANHHQAMCRLMLGDFAAGWAQYEWRWRTEQLGGGRTEGEAPLWLGEPGIAGRTILAHAEQGLGDTLQFCRYVRDLAALGARVVLEVQPGLERLLAGLEGVSEVTVRGQPRPPHDVQTPLMSLPHALGQARGAPIVPDARPYLRADPAEAAAWAERLGDGQAVRVGVCWAGGVRPDQFVADSIDRRRSLPLSALAPLGGVEGVRLFSLQKGPPAAQLAALRPQDWPGPPVVDLTGELADFAATAALVANLDLVITCDTAVAHLAGGLGKAVWVLNRHDACWRWMDGREDSPWYAQAQLFRQEAPGDWTPVIAAVRQALAAFRRAPTAPRPG